MWRSSKNKTKKLIGFFLTGTKDEVDKRSLETQLNAILKVFKTMFTFCSTDAQPAGEKLWAYMINNNRNGIVDGLPAWFMKQFNNDEQKISDKMTRDCDTYFSSNRVYDFDNHWDRFLLDHVIKEETLNQLEFESFDGLTEDAKNVLFRNYPSSNLPDWDPIVKEEYLN